MQYSKRKRTCGVVRMCHAVHERCMIPCHELINLQEDKMVYFLPTLLSDIIPHSLKLGPFASLSSLGPESPTLTILHIDMSRSKSVKDAPPAFR